MFDQAAEEANCSLAFFNMVCTRLLQQAFWGPRVIQGILEVVLGMLKVAPKVLQVKRRRWFWQCGCGFGVLELVLGVPEVVLGSLQVTMGCAWHTLSSLQWHATLFWESWRSPWETWRSLWGSWRFFWNS